MSKTFVFLTPVVLGGMWYTGALTGASTQEVARPPAQVMEALADLDIRRQPGNPGTDASRSGGVTPVFSTERTANSITFVVMSGNQVATRMTAHLEPIDEGRGTRVTADVERGDSPDEQTSPAFRSEGLTLGLFTSAITDELNELTAPPPASAESCDALRDQIMLENMAAVGATKPEDVGQAIGQTIGTIGQIAKTGKRLREAGCADTSRRAGDAFKPISNEMGRGSMVR
ncbi:MAG TPA: hypothetical protein VF631_08440 [Allosphingosinicella sp.]|jgi:hypothetical protein|uniref:hypothetical protein n=1 Tax=Allosphingosinicella sp. TaxID=2823234 RepID=UPI002F2AF0E2